MQKYLCYGLFIISQLFSFCYADGMIMDETGMIMNANEKTLPRDCQAISENVAITIRAGHHYAIPSKMFGFNEYQWHVKPCAKITLTFINEDTIRHQLMIHGLPGYLYPDGMVHLELYGKGQLQAVFIVPSQKKTYLIHCEIPQHAEKGMKAQLKVDGGDGDLPSIPTISAPVKSDYYVMNWTIMTSLLLLLALIAGIAIPLLLFKTKTSEE